jgi:hypothetical protein
MRTTYFPEEFLSKYKKFCGKEWPEFCELPHTKVWGF